MDELPDDLIPVRKPDDRELSAGTPAELPDGLVPVGSGAPRPPMSGMPEGYQPTTDPAVTQRVNEGTTVTGVLDAFEGKLADIQDAAVRGAKEAWGEEPLGSWLMKQPGMKTDLSTEVGKVAGAFNEVVNRPLAAILDAAVRAPSALYRAAQSAGVEAGLPRDVVSMPDAFMGSPGGLARYKTPLQAEVAKNRAALGDRTPIAGGTASNPDVNVAADLGVIGPPRPNISGLAPADAAAALVQPIKAFHGSPYAFEAFTTEKIGTGEGAASYGHGLYFAEHPKVAEGYKDKFGEMKFGTAEYTAAKFLDRNGGDRAAALKELEENRDLSGALGWRNGGGAWPEGKRAWELLKSDEEIARPSHLYEVRIHADKDMMLDLDKSIREQSPQVKEALKEIGFTEADATDGHDLYRQLSTTNGKRLPPDENGMIRTNGPEEASRLLHEAGIHGIKYLDQGSRRGPGGMNSAGMTLDMPPKTSNFVVFDDSRVEIVARNGQPIERPPASVPLATREMAAEAGKDVVRSEPVNQWRERFDEFVAKLETPDQVKDLIRNAAKDNDFEAARRGDLSLAHQEALSHASGIPVEEMNVRGIGRNLKNDSEVRLATQAMIKQSQDVADLMKQAAHTNDIADLTKLQEAIMRRDLLVEQFIGLRAEWGRTGNVFQEFTEGVKDAQSLGKFLADKKGRSLDDLRNLAKLGAELDPNTQLPRFLSDGRKFGWNDKLFYFWTNSVLSGAGSQAAYGIADAIFTAYVAAVIQPTTGAIGAVRQALAGGEKVERVYMGETVARLAGLVKGTPDALIAAWEAIKTGNPTLLEAEKSAMSLEQISKHDAITGQRPIPGVAGTIIGIPTRLLSVEQTFFKFLNYRAEVEAQAYRQAVKDGHSPLDRDFWQRQSDNAAFPKEDVMTDAVAHANYMTYVKEFGPSGKSLQMFLARTPVAKWIVPFLRTPGNFLKIAVENSPAAFMSSEVRANLRGENGPIARDNQWAKIVVGSAVGTMVFNMAQSDQVTGMGPPPGKERDIWLLDHKPNSVKIGNQWWSYMKVGGPLAATISFAADLNDIKHAMSEKEYGEAAARFTLSVANTTVNQTGLSGLANIMKAMSDPERYGKRWINNTLTSFIPASTALGQVSSSMDPVMRDTKNLTDALINKTPWRTTLYPLRDWMGRPMANDGEEFGAIIQHRKVNQDPIDMELKALDIRPTRPEERIHGVKLNQEQYDVYQSTAGMLTGQMLNTYVNSDSWHEMAPFVRKNIIMKTIESSRQQAASAMQMRYPELIQHGVEDRVRAINGQKPIWNK